MLIEKQKLWALLPVFVFIAFFGIAFLSLQEATSQSMPQVGDNAPDFALVDKEGKKIQLADFKNKKYVLVDFWASWCGPCRKENPYVVKAFEEFRNKDFVILSISLDKDRSKWIKAIQQDGLTWQWHAGDLLDANKGEVAKKYAVRFIPSNFLVDKSGKIIALNLRGSELAETLKKMIGS